MALTIDNNLQLFGYTLRDDDVAEPTETFQLVLSPGAGSAVGVQLFIATIFITDSDGELFSKLLQTRMNSSDRSCRQY